VNKETDVPLAAIKSQNSQIYTEVVTWDSYRLSSLNFNPGLIIDIGANIGAFSAHAAKLFPHAEIICVEPHPETFETCRKNLIHLENVSVINAALGIAPVGFHDGKCNWRHGYRTVDKNHEPTKTPVRAVMLDDLVAENETRDYIVKIDCEGAECDILYHNPSLGILSRSAYWCAELHFDEELPENGTPLVNNSTGHYFAKHKQSILKRIELAYVLCGTHTIQLELFLSGGMVWATQRNEKDPWRKP
jgi:FkbM family methyltransferase